MGRTPRDAFGRLLDRVAPGGPPQIVLSDDTIAHLQVTSARLRLPDHVVPGLMLRVSPSGVKSWSMWLRSRREGRARTVTLGRWPAIPTEEARKLATTLRDRDRSGLQPEIPGAEVTLRRLTADFKAAFKSKLRPKTFEDYSLLLDGPIAQLGSIPLGALSRSEIRRWHERISEGRPVLANRALFLLRRVLNWAVDEEQLVANPAARVRPNRENSRSRILSPDEIKKLWAAWVAEASGSSRALRLMLATGQRKSEVLSMAWADIEPGEPTWWTIPGARTKNSQPHRVPLVGLARELLGPAWSDWVFPAERTTYGPRKRAPVPYLSNPMKAVKRSTLTAGVAPWTPHDLRRTMASGLAQLGTPTATIAKVLNHVEPGSGVTAIYVRASFDKQKLEALWLWDQALRQLLGMV